MGCSERNSVSPALPLLSILHMVTFHGKKSYQCDIIIIIIIFLFFLFFFLNKLAPRFTELVPRPIQSISHDVCVSRSSVHWCVPRDSVAPICRIFLVLLWLFLYFCLLIFSCFFPLGFLELFFFFLFQPCFLCPFLISMVCFRFYFLFLSFFVLFFLVFLFWYISVFLVFVLLSEQLKRSPIFLEASQKLLRKIKIY